MRKTYLLTLLIIFTGLYAMQKPLVLEMKDAIREWQELSEDDEVGCREVMQAVVCCDCLNETECCKEHPRTYCNPQADSYFGIACCIGTCSLMFFDGIRECTCALLGCLLLKDIEIFNIRERQKVRDKGGTIASEFAIDEKNASNINPNITTAQKNAYAQLSAWQHIQMRYRLISEMIYNSKKRN